jgi:RNA polymerase sigma factor (sigma-70 family)
MSSSALAAGLRLLRGKLAVQQHNDDSDEQLLYVFLSRRDDSAFAALVHRHGPMVLHVCRRVLGHEQDAEDAFQATFLVLAQSAARLRKKTALASWLHGIAYRLALKAKQTAVRRRKREEASPRSAWERGVRPPANPADELSWREVRTFLDEEIARLPEIYRSVFVFCVLESVSIAETARRLGLKEGTAASRLAEARKRLQWRLARRGVELTAVLGAAALSVQPASALPPLLISTTLKAASATALGETTAGLVSAHVAGLVKSAASTKILSKIVLFLALAGGALAVGAGVSVYREPPTPSADPPRAEAAKPAAAKPADAVTVRGRVLGPDGKPVQGARLYWPRLPKTPPRTEEDIEKMEIPQRGKTDADGRFQFELPQADIKPEWKLVFIAAADGYGVAWTDWPTIAAGGELTLRLVKDQPIEGRIVNTEGKPQAGVRVSIATLGAMKEGKVDAFLAAWKREWQMAIHQATERMFQPLNQVLPAATTDLDGHFRIVGAGADRLVVLRVRGPGIAQEVLYVVTQAGFDAAPVNKAVRDRTPAMMRLPGQLQLLYGPELTYVVPASRSIEGTVREAGSSNPVAGYVVSVIVGYGESIRAISDKDGRYKLVGVPKERQYVPHAEPPPGSSWLRSGARIDDTEGVQPLSVDFTVARGVLLSGRILDKTTGKGVKGSIRFVPLPGNKFAGKPGYDSYKYERLVSEVGADGRFQLAVIPGLGVLMFQADGKERVNGGKDVNPYKQAEFDAKEREQVKVTQNDDGSRFTAVDNSIEFLSFLNAVKLLDLAPDAGTATCDLFVERGATQTIRIEDADGKPLTGTTVAGVTDGWPIPSPIKDATCTIFALDPNKPRRLLFFHAERKLAGSLTVRGDEKEPPVVHLGPVGSVIGRMLDREGQPLAGANIDLSSPDPTTRELYRQLRLRQQATRTDKDGRFRIEGIIPEVKFTLSITQGRTFLIGEPLIGARQVKPGETLDLGDVRVKPGP